MDSRAAFEAWYESSSGYGDESYAWAAWQASRRAALEEAAKACDGLGAGLYAHAVGPYARCASAIRALAQGGGE